MKVIKPGRVCAKRDAMARDPICGMKVDAKTAKWISKYNGKNYYFCSERCKLTFDKSPEKYAKK